MIGRVKHRNDFGAPLPARTPLSIFGVAPASGVPVPPPSYLFHSLRL